MIGSLYAPHPGGEFLRTGKPSHNSKRTNPSEHSHINYKKRHIMKKIWSIIACLMMILAICSPVFAADTSVTATLPMLTDEEMDAMRAHEHAQIIPKRAEMMCPDCFIAGTGNVYLALYCVRPMDYSHTTTHSTSSGICSVMWFTGTYRYQCNKCGFIAVETTISGHPCEINHSKCADESWCLANRVVYE